MAESNKVFGGDRSGNFYMEFSRNGLKSSAVDVFREPKGLVLLFGNQA